MHFSHTTSVMDRRRTRRYHLQPSIALSFFNCMQENISLGAGKLLNLSVDGMACIVTKSTCQTLTDLHDFQVNLTVSEPNQQLRMSCQFANAIEGAEENEYIVGIEFKGAADESSRDQLSDILSRRGN